MNYPEHPHQRVYLDSGSAEIVDEEMLGAKREIPVPEPDLVLKVRGEFKRCWSVALAFLAAEGALALTGGCFEEEKKPVPNCQGVPSCIDEHVKPGPGGVLITTPGEETFSPED